MTIKKNDARQEVVSAWVDFTLADVSAGTVMGAIELPGGAIVLRGSVVVTEAFNAGTTATLIVGDAADDNRYTGTPLDVTTTGVKAVTPTGYVKGGQGDVTVKFAQTGTAATTGAARLIIEYIVQGKAEFTQG